VFVAEATVGTRVRMVAAWYEGDFLEDLQEYDTRGQACSLAVERAVVAFPDALTRRFPDDEAAVSMGVESYLAICLRASDQTYLGHLALLDARPMEAEEEDIAALRIFAARAAAELERRRQAAALTASHKRVIEAADAERRRFGRDLHDGAQQRLMAVSNLLTATSRKLGEDSGAGPLLDAAREELSAANAELRELARGLHPVALSERGLRDALESLAAGCAVPVELDVVDAPLPEGVELAAYFLVAESLTNVGRYAQANGARVSAVQRDGALRVEVSDDGVGGADPTAGTGLRGLADRMQVLGGELAIDSPSGAGTRVTATIPLG
jgi:signal transduction histidine kinase